MTSEHPPHRPVRSFVRREGRITRAQQKALDEYWEEFGLDARDEAFRWGEVFGREAPVVVEIGFGDGRSLLEMAQAAPECNYVGVEVYRPGVGALLSGLKRGGIWNVRVIMMDAVEFLRGCAAPSSLDKLLIFFPDPWPKKRHRKRRLIQAPFVALAADRLVPGGRIHCATDWEDYAGQMMEVLSACDLLENENGPGRYAERPSYRPRTKYECRGHGLGHRTWDLIFRRISM